MLAVKALASLHIYTGSPEHRHITGISCAGSNGDLKLFLCVLAVKALASLHIC